MPRRCACRCACAAPSCLGSASARALPTAAAVATETRPAGPDLALAGAGLTRSCPCLRTGRGGSLVRAQVPDRSVVDRSLGSASRSHLTVVCWACPPRFDAAPPVACPVDAPGVVPSVGAAGVVTPVPGAVGVAACAGADEAADAAEAAAPTWVAEDRTFLTVAVTAGGVGLVTIGKALFCVAGSGSPETVPLDRSMYPRVFMRTIPISAALRASEPVAEARSISSWRLPAVSLRRADSRCRSPSASEPWARAVLSSSRAMRPAMSRAMHVVAKVPVPVRVMLLGMTRSGVGAGPRRGARSGRAVAVIWLIGWVPSWSCCRVLSVLLRAAGVAVGVADALGDAKAGRAARGLAVTSASSGVLGAPGDEGEVCRVLGELDGKPGGRARGRPRGERAFRRAVLEGVVRQDRDPAADGEDVDRLVDGAAPDLELVVDLDAQGLEGPLGRVAALALRGAGMTRRSMSTSRPDEV